MRNPKTTMAGILSAVAVVAATIGKYLGGEPVDWNQAVVAAIALFQSVMLYKAQDSAK